MKPHFSPYVIAEIGVNHEGKMDLAKKLIELAKAGGADAAKFQSYKAEKLAAKNSPAYWDTSKESSQNQFQLFKRYDAFGEKEYRELAQHCEKLGIDFMSTPFDLEAVAFLNPLIKRIKIASADLTNLPLLSAAAKLRKPMILSTGASTLQEIQESVQFIKRAGCNDLTLLHCVLNYPTPDEHAHIARMVTLKEAFTHLPIGYSDHTVPDPHMATLVLSCLLGAVVIEKHFTHDKTLPGNDHYHAMDVNDLQIFRAILKKMQLLYGSGVMDNLGSQDAARLHARRSIVTSRFIAKGEKLKESDLICKRPGSGISPTAWDLVVGNAPVRDLEEDTILSWSDLQKQPPKT